MKKARVGVLAVFALLAACTAGPPPAETTADGLVRVPSRPEGGVYRKPDADFTRYKRLMVEPLTVEFLKGWRKQHPDVSDSEVRRIEAETAKNFLEVFSAILIDEGPFELAEVRDGLSGDILLRVNMIDSEDRFKVNHTSGPNRLSNAREIRDALERWSRLVREAIDVGKASKPR